MNKIKSTLLMMTLLGTVQAYALPIMNRNSPGAGPVNIFPDSKDQNLYYYGPNKLIMAETLDRVPMLSYMEFKAGFNKKAIIQSIVRPSFHQTDLDLALNNIKAINPHAYFASLPFISSRVEISEEFMPVIESSDCNHLAGNINDDQTCILKVSPRGRSVMVDALTSSGGVALTFVYKVLGVTENADGKYDSRELEFGVGGVIGGTVMKSHPELFLWW